VDGGHDALRPSSNVDYLLEDVEEPHRSRGKMILVVVALALAVGFGYLHWKRGGFDWLNAGEKKPSPAAMQNADSAASPAADAGPQAAAGTATSGANPAESSVGQAAPVQTPPPAAGDAAPAATPQSASQSSAGDSSAAASAPQAADSDADKQAPAVEEKPRVVARKPAAKPAAAKPAAVKPAAGRAGDSVTEAERYIYGRGAAQDCDGGLRILKPAAESNVKAMISMGAMYSTGTCTPRDLPTAYRWFALALHKEPDNQALQEDLQKLWGQMTQPERQLAIKLSQ
jgi:TPR repeat protein